MTGSFERLTQTWLVDTKSRIRRTLVTNPKPCDPVYSYAIPGIGVVKATKCRLSSIITSQVGDLANELAPETAPELIDLLTQHRARIRAEIRSNLTTIANDICQKQDGQLHLVPESLKFELEPPYIWKPFPNKIGQPNWTCERKENYQSEELQPSPSKKPGSNVIPFPLPIFLPGPIPIPLIP